MVLDTQGLDMPKVQLQCANQCNSTKIAQLERGNGLLHTELIPYKAIWFSDIDQATAIDLQRLL